MEGHHDKYHSAAQIPESQTGCRVADFLDLTAVGPRGVVRRAKLERIRRPMHPNIQRRGRAIHRIGGHALASNGGAAALARIVVARGFDHRDLILSDRLAEPRSLMQELIVAPRQEK
jgi:hypothetical protein